MTKPTFAIITIKLPPSPWGITIFPNIPEKKKKKKEIDRYSDQFLGHTFHTSIVAEQTRRGGGWFFNSRAEEEEDDRRLKIGNRRAQSFAAEARRIGPASTAKQVFSLCRRGKRGGGSSENNGGESGGVVKSWGGLARRRS